MVVLYRVDQRSDVGNVSAYLMCNARANNSETGCKPSAKLAMETTCVRLAKQMRPRWTTVGALAAHEQFERQSAKEARATKNKSKKS